MQQLEEEPEWLVRAGQELERMLKQWQQRQEERLDEGQTQQRAQEGTPTGVTRQVRRTTDGTTSPAKFGGFSRAARRLHQ